ncbi:MAG: hypothetical protein L6461_04995 [Anaerolineae bacterium]|nr:hypothetical protein [Anaerolineae bacterium]
MPILEVHICQCADCTQKVNHPNKQFHQQLNLLLSRLDEQQRRWYVAVEANSNKDLTGFIRCLVPQCVLRRQLFDRIEPLENLSGLLIITKETTP